MEKKVHYLAHNSPLLYPIMAQLYRFQIKQNTIMRYKLYHYLSIYNYIFELVFFLRSFELKFCIDISFLPLGATAQGELWPLEQSASILIMWFLNNLVFTV
jgi:hypothetical protein